MDGKTFAGDQIIIAMGVTTTGEKRILGLVQTATENKRACTSFLREIEERGFRAPNGLLAVLVGVNFRTTNLIESVMARLEEKTQRVDNWKTSDQKLRWCGAALLAVEKNFRRVKGHKQLHLLASALKAKMNATTEAAA